MLSHVHPSLFDAEILFYREIEDSLYSYSNLNRYVFSSLNVKNIFANLFSSEKQDSRIVQIMVY